MPEDKAARAHERIDELEGRIVRVESDVAPLLRSIRDVLGTPPVPATNTPGSGLCKSVADLQAIEAAKAEEKARLAAEKARRAETIKTIGALLAALVAGGAIIGGLVKLAQAMVR